MSEPVRTTITVELELEVVGTYEPYVPATPPTYDSGGDAPYGDTVEDAAISDIITEKTTRTTFLANEASLRPYKIQTTTTRSSLLEGIDTSLPSIQSLLQALYTTFESDIIHALRTEALSHD